MTDATAPIGHNNPPEPTPYEAILTDVQDLSETAQGFLDGDPINDQATADMVAKLIDEARKGQKAAEDLRKEEAKPFDDGKKAVQAKWTPITDEKKGKYALIIATAKKALAPWLVKLDAEQEAAREKARRSEEHTSELQSLMRNSYAVFCLKNKKNFQLMMQQTNTNTLRRP